jgi:hypothetical protein
MATRGERAKADQQRDNQRKNPKARATTPSEHKAGVDGTARRNLRTSPAKLKGGPALESSANGKPSRKSTRGSTEHIKLATNLQRRQVRRTHSSAARAARASVR